MKIEHAGGSSVETNNLPDVDAILMEECQKLHALFSKYNRQLFLIGEMIAKEGLTANNGCSFFHITTPENAKNPDVFNKDLNRYYGRIDGHIRGMSRQTLGIGRIPPPEVQPYPAPEEPTSEEL